MISSPCVMVASGSAVERYRFFRLGRRDRVELESLSGKVAVVTGAARGFGLALATALSEEAVCLVLADNDEVALKDAVASFHDTEVNPTFPWWGGRIPRLQGSGTTRNFDRR